MAETRDPPQQKDVEKDESVCPVRRQFTHFGIVVQLNEPSQMEVFRWLQTDDAYRLIWILHERDLHGDGTRKAPHIHGIVKVSRKCSGSTMYKRFGAYLYFEELGDPSEYARYLTHSTFASRSKTRYDKNEVQGDITLYNELTKTHEATPIEAVERWLGYKRSAVNGGCLDGLPTQMERNDIEREIDKIALRLALDAGDLQLVKSIMSHSYFYKTFT